MTATETARRRKAGFGGRTIQLAGATKGVRVASAADLALIQQFAVNGRTVTAADVAVFEMDVCNDQLDRDTEKFARDVLQDFVDTLPGKGWLIAHQWGPPGEGLIFRATSEERDGVLWVVGAGYLPLLGNEVFVNKLELGVSRFVSIGFMCPDVVEINGPQGSYWEWRRGPNGEKAEAYEVSSVFLGSQINAMVRKGVLRGLGVGGEHPEFRASLKRAVAARPVSTQVEEFLESIKSTARRMFTGQKDEDESPLVERGEELLLDTFEALVQLLSQARQQGDDEAVDELVEMADAVLDYFEDDEAEDEGKTARLTKGRAEITAAKATRQAAKGDEAMGLTKEDRDELKQLIEAAIKGATDPLAASLKTVTDGQATQVAELTAIKTGQTELTAKVGAVEGEVTAVKTKVTEFGASMTDLVGGVDAAGKEVEGVLGLVVDRIETMETIAGLPKAATVDEGGDADKTPPTKKSTKELFGSLLRKSVAA